VAANPGAAANGELIASGIIKRTEGRWRNYLVPGSVNEAAADHPVRDDVRARNRNAQVKAAIEVIQRNAIVVGKGRIVQQQAR
jgi:hypothetical protein